jgi:hypothetical protein
MFPIYGQSRKHDVVTDNYLYPIFQRTHGDGLSGWQVWPLVGHETKTVTTKTNGFGDIETVGGHDSLFVLWPLYLNDKSALGTTNPVWQLTSLPLFSFVRSPLRDSSTIIWPFFNHIKERGKGYEEWDAPWPFIEFAHGPGKTTKRVWPFFSQSHSPILESDFYLWPIYKYNAAETETLDRKRTRIVFFLYSDTKERNKETGKTRRRVDQFPFFTYRADFAGNRRLQLLALLEPFTSGSHKIDRDWSPVWSLWRSEWNDRTGATSQSLLWNLYRRETTPASKKCSLLFGLFQYQSSPEGKRMRLLYIPVVNTKSGSAKP